MGDLFNKFIYRLEMGLFIAGFCALFDLVIILIIFVLMPAVGLK